MPADRLDRRLLLRSLPIPAVLVTPDGSIVDSSAAAARLFSLTRESLNGSSFETLVDPGDQSVVSATLAEASDEAASLTARLASGRRARLRVAAVDCPAEHRLITLDEITPEAEPELDALLQATRGLDPRQELDDLLDDIFEQLRRVVDYDGAAIGVTEHGALVWLAQRGPEGRTTHPGARLPRPPEDRLAPIWHTISERRHVVIDDLLADAPGDPHLTDFRRIAVVHPIAGEDARSCLFVPLSAGERVTGMIALWGRQPAAYGPRDIALAGVIGVEAGMAIANARFYQRSQAMLTLSHGAASLTVDQPLEETLRGLAAGIIRATRAVACSIVLVEPGGVPRLAAGQMLPHDFALLLSEHWLAEVGWPLRQPKRLQDTTILRRARAQANGEPRLLWESAQLIPIVYRDMPLGAICAYYRPAIEPDPEEESLLLAMADQAAVAVENTRLYQRSLAIAAMTRVAASLTVNQPLRAALDVLAATVVQATGAIACSVVQIEERTGLARVSGWHGLPDGYIEAMELSWANGAASPTVESFRTRRIVAVPDQPRWALADPLFAPTHPYLRVAEWDKAFVVPIQYHDRPLGAINVYYRPGSAMSEDEENLLLVIADQAAVAMENARLFDEAQSQAALGERQRLARELHDSVTQALFSTTLHTRAAQLALAQEGLDPDGPLGRGLDQLRTLTQGALAEMRALIFELRPEALAEEGLVAALTKQAAAISAREGLPIAVRGPAQRLPLSHEAEENLYRLALEALHNTVKHARAERAWVSIECCQDDALSVEVGDNGAGFETGQPHPGHLGLITMRQRAAQIGADFAIESTPGAGTVVRARLAASEDASSAGGHDE